MIALDFETYYNGKYSVANMGNRLYCRDPRFKVLMVAAYSPDYQQTAVPTKFDWAALDGQEIVAHNAAFDRAVFERCKELGICPPNVQPATWHDSAALCAYAGLPRSLDGAVKEVFGVKLDKSVRERMQYGDLFDDVEEYAAGDAMWCWRLWDRLSDKWPESEQEILRLTDEMGDLGVCLDMQAAEKAREHLAGIIESVEQALPFAPVASFPAFKAACNKYKQPIPPGTSMTDAKVDKWCKQHQESESPLWVRHVQQWRRANRTLRVVEAMIARVNPDAGRMQYQLKYFGAVQTGRWSGGGGLNMQNFNRSNANGVDLRGLIVPGDGKVFVIADYAQIEARVLHWLAGDYDFLDKLAEGADIYEVAARRMLGYSDPAPLKQKNPQLRQLSKAMTLGLGFGMGARQFVSGAKILAGVDLAFEECQRHVNTYRTKNPRIPELWYRLAGAFERRHEKPYYGLRLPSGRLIRYWKPECDGDMTCEQEKGGRREFIHPGLLCENMVQATARDLLAEAWRRCASDGFQAVMCVHDELVFEVDEQTAESDLRHIIELMEIRPAWQDAERLPIEVEATIAERYGK